MTLANVVIQRDLECTKSKPATNLVDRFDHLAGKRRKAENKDWSDYKETKRAS